MYNFKILTKVDAVKWNRDLTKSQCATFLQTAEYLSSEPNDNYFPVFIYVFDENGNVVGQLGLRIIKTAVLYSSPLTHRFSKLISNITARGIWLYGPIIHTDDKKQKLEILEAVIRANNAILDQCNLVFIEGYSPPLDFLVDNDYINEFVKNGYTIGKYVAFITNLNKPIEEIWKKVQKYTKINVKRASKRGIIIKELETYDELKEVLSLHQKWAGTKGLVITDPLREIEKLWNRYKTALEKTFLAYKDKELISSISINHFNGIVVPTQVLNSYSDATSLGGPALTWHAIKWSKESGMRIYDITGGPLLSENDPDPDNTRPLTHYKRKWGGDQHIHYNFLKVRKKLSYVLYTKLFHTIRWYHDHVRKLRSNTI